MPYLPEELWELVYIYAGSSKDKSTLRRCCPALYKSQLINRHVTSCCLELSVKEAFPGEAIKKLQAYPRHASLEALKIVARDEDAEGRGPEGILEVLLLLSSSNSEVSARLHNVASLTIQGSLPFRNHRRPEEVDTRPRGSVIKARCGELLPQLLPRLLGTDGGQNAGRVEFIDCNLCSGAFLSVFASNVQLRSLSVNYNNTVTDDPSELVRNICQFEGLQDLSISLQNQRESVSTWTRLDESLLSLADLDDLQTLQTLSFANCFITDIDVLQDLPNLLELNLHSCIYLPIKGSIQLISPSLQTLRIDKLTFAHHTVCAGLPALKQIIFSSFDFADAPLGDESQLQRMILELASMPLQAMESKDSSTISLFARKFPSFRCLCDYGRVREAGYKHLISTLQMILESPLAEVFRSLKVVSLAFGASQLGPGSMRLIYSLFPGAEQISIVEGCTDVEAFAAAISCNTHLKTLQLCDDGNPAMHATIVPALLAALRLGKSFELCLYVGYDHRDFGYNSEKQLKCIFKEWEDLKKKAAGAGPDVRLSIKDTGKDGFPP